MDKLTIYSNRVELAEVKPGEDIHAKFCLCDFDVNHNGTKLNRETAENWIGTIINKPLVGRVRGGDFTGHNMRVVTKIAEDGTPYQSAEFDTEAFGTFTSYAIETVDDKEVITAECEIWSRFASVCDLIKKRVNAGTLQTSWEIMVNNSHMDGLNKVIDDGKFTALCVLGAKTPPAYDSSKLLETASADDGDEELANAFDSDIASDEKEIETVEHENATEVIEQVSETTTEETKPVEGDVETKEDVEESECNPDKEESAEDVEEPEHTPTDEENEEEETAATEDLLTMRDIRRKLEEALRDVGYKTRAYYYISLIFPESHIFWAKEDMCDSNELDYTQYTYSVVDGSVVLGEPEKITLSVSPRQINTVVAEKADAIVSANEKIKSLEAEVSQLKPYKDAAVEAETAQKKDNLKNLAVRSGMFETSEIESGEIATMIAELDEQKLKLCIADRCIASAKKPEVEVSSRKENSVERNLSDEEDTYVDLLGAYINKE